MTVDDITGIEIFIQRDSGIEFNIKSYTKDIGFMGTKIQGIIVLYGGNPYHTISLRPSWLISAINQENGAWKLKE